MQTGQHELLPSSQFLTHFRYDIVIVAYTVFTGHAVRAIFGDGQADNDSYLLMLRLGWTAQ